MVYLRRADNTTIFFFFYYVINKNIVIGTILLCRKHEIIFFLLLFGLATKAISYKSRLSVTLDYRPSILTRATLSKNRYKRFYIKRISNNY